MKTGTKADAGAQKYEVARGRNDERFGAVGLSGIERRDRDARSARSYTCIFSLKPRPDQRGRNCEQSIADQNRRCSNALRGSKTGRIGQPSVCIN